MELGLDPKRSQMNLGWFSNGQWVTSYPIKSVSKFPASLDFLRAFGFVSPIACLPTMKLVWGNAR